MIKLDTATERRLEEALMLSINDELHRGHLISDDDYLSAKREIVILSRLTEESDDVIIKRNVINPKNKLENG